MKYLENRDKVYNESFVEDEIHELMRLRMPVQHIYLCYNCDRDMKDTIEREPGVEVHRLRCTHC